MKCKRRGRGYIWEMETSTSIIRGHTVDNLDKKEFSEASNKFEWAFILLREVTSENEFLCMDNEKDRLDLCQAFAERYREERYKESR